MLIKLINFHYIMLMQIFFIIKFKKYLEKMEKFIKLKLLLLID